MYKIANYTDNEVIIMMKDHDVNIRIAYVNITT